MVIMVGRIIQFSLICALGLFVAACQGKSPDSRPRDTSASVDSGAKAAPPVGVKLGSREGRFNVEFPPGFTNPEQRTVEVETPAGKLPMTLYTSSQDTSSAYMIAFLDYPLDAFQAGIEKMLDGAREGALKNMNATLEKQESVTLSGHPGRSITFKGTSQGKEVFGRIDYYIAKPRLYQILFLTSNKARVTTPEITKCFSSFTITADTTQAAAGDTTAAPADTAKK